MWNRLPEAWRVSLSLAWESYCEGSIPIAAVVTDGQGKIVSRGRNRSGGAPSVEANQIGGNQLAHAELNALLALDERAVDVRACQLHTLVEPCPLCIGAICMSGLKQVRYAARDSWSGSIDLLEASSYLRWKQIEAIPPEDTELETLIHMLQVDRQLQSGHARAREVIEKWAVRDPEGVRLGRILFESGSLARLQADGASPTEVVTALHRWMNEW